MTHIEQHKIILELREYEGKMSRQEQETFRMFVKRDKDDEDIDEVSRKQLMQLYQKYVVNRPKRVVQSPFGDRIER